MICLGQIFETKYESKKILETIYRAESWAGLWLFLHRLHDSAKEREGAEMSFDRTGFRSRVALTKICSFPSLIIPVLSLVVCLFCSLPPSFRQLLSWSEMRRVGGCCCCRAATSRYICIEYVRMGSFAAGDCCYGLAETRSSQSTSRDTFCLKREITTRSKITRKSRGPKN